MTPTREQQLKKGTRDQHQSADVVVPLNGNPPRIVFDMVWKQHIVVEH
jgi:hypothetical protein